MFKRRTVMMTTSVVMAAALGTASAVLKLKADLDADSVEVAAPIPASRSQSTNEDEDATILDPGTPLAGRYIVTLKHTVDGPMSSKASSPKNPQQMRGALTVSMLESLSGRDFDSPKRL